MYIRIAGAEDIEEVSKLWLAMANELHPSEKPNVEWWIELVEGMMNNSAYFMFVLEDAEKLVGFADIFLMRVPLTGKIHMIGMSLYVKPEYRNTMYAGLLYRKAIQTAKRIGATTIEIICGPTEFSKWGSIGYTVSSMTVKKV